MGPKTNVLARYVEGIVKNVPCLMAEANVVGVSISLVEAGCPAWSGCFGLADASSKARLSEDTLLEAASLTKPLFAYSVMKAIDMGLLELERPLADYLSDECSDDSLLGYVSNTPELQTVTARHVLSHSAGFPNWRKKREGSDPEPLVVRFRPGSRFSYSGEGYVLLQHIMDRVTGGTSKFIDQTVLRPLNMNRSTLHWPDDAVMSPKARGHDSQGLPQDTRTWDVNMAASLHTTAIEYSHFLMQMVTEKSESVNTMLTPHVQVNTSGSWADGWPDAAFDLWPSLYWGLGWGLEYTPEGDCFWQWGDNGSFRGLALGFPKEQSALVILSNSAGAQDLWPRLATWPKNPDYQWIRWLTRLYD